MKKFLKIVSTIFFIILLVLGGVVFYMFKTNAKKVVTPEQVMQIASKNDIIANKMSGFSQLTEDEKAVYVRIVEETDALNNHFYITGNPVNTETFDKVYKAVLQDHPEYFFLNEYKLSVDMARDIVEEVTFTYPSDTDTIKQQQADIEAWADKALSQVNANMSAYETAKTLHDYLVANVAYDSSAPNNQNLLSVCENNRTVCAGYSRAYQYLLNKAGIFATYVTGNTKNEGHAWNLIEIDGQYGWVDITWDDPSFADPDVPQGLVSHAEFGLSTAELLSNHVIDASYAYIGEIPKPDFNYFVKEGLQFDLNNSGEFDRFTSLLRSEKAAGNSYVEIRMADTDQVDQLLNLLSYDSVVNDMQINYYQDEYNPVILFVMN